MEKVLCEKCKQTEGQLYHAFEVDSWETKHPFTQNKESYHLCLSCFDLLMNEAIETEEIAKRKEVNRKSLEKAIEAGLACPKCKTMIFEEDHTCLI
ncbi:hypothetical protein BEP19_08360 [Ammoniphilus oxalaticus]|uniref:Uncharacterized protein n=1 Tax=Ammoniphilus oxalaticus TaxID=66863 RepID=A0A419SK34_9BACL|nr:hypothetical protein [Ammoniphilus oxalaticus]RKD24394.1 hypothetical protein BEP19_08360 [Ammoniphilus oxalaticus]